MAFQILPLNPEINKQTTFKLVFIVLFTEGHIKAAWSANLKRRNITPPQQLGPYFIGRLRAPEGLPYRPCLATGTSFRWTLTPWRCRVPSPSWYCRRTPGPPPNSGTLPPCVTWTIFSPVGPMFNKVDQEEHRIQAAFSLPYHKLMLLLPSVLDKQMGRDNHKCNVNKLQYTLHLFSCATDLREWRSCEGTELTSAPPKGVVATGGTHVKQALPLGRLGNNPQFPVLTVPNAHLGR